MDIPPARRPDSPPAGAPAADPVWLQLMWLASPALPVGGFSYSEGLEAAVEAGWVADEAGARDWLCNQMALGPARSELPLLAQAHAAWAAGDAARAQALNDFVHRSRESAEGGLQTRQMGRSLLEWLRNQPDAADDVRLAQLARLAPAPTWPLAFALATVRCGANAAQALHAYLFGWAENQVQAALKAVPLGQLAGQRLLQALVAGMPAVIDGALRRPEPAWQAFSPAWAIACARHETQYSRLFRS